MRFTNNILPISFTLDKDFARFFFPPYLISIHTKLTLFSASGTSKKTLKKSVLYKMSCDQTVAVVKPNQIFISYIKLI